jgi:hypothetical protein
MNSYKQKLAWFRFDGDRTCRGRRGSHSDHTDDRWLYTTLAISDGKVSVFAPCAGSARRQFTVEIPGGATAGLGTAPRFAGACDGNNGCGGWVPVVPLRPAGRNHDTDDGPSGSE